MTLYNRIIKHKSFKDVCGLVTKEFKLAHKTKLKIMWINQGFTKSYFMNEMMNIEIKTKDRKDWLICDDKFSGSCLRYRGWKEIV